MIKIWFKEGPSLRESLYVAAEVDQTEQLIDSVAPVVVRATHVLSPAYLEALDRIAASEATPEEKKAEADKLPVQPEKFTALFQASCKTLEEFKALALHLAANKGDLDKTAAEMGKEPTMATEPRDKVKVGDEPKVAAEAGMTGGTVKTEAAPGYKQLMNRMPSKAVGTPERAVDLKSSQDPALQVLAEQVEAYKIRAEEAEAALKQKNKDDELGEVMNLLTEVGALEDAKDRDKFTKLLGALDDKAIGAVETVLKAVRDAKSKPAGGPKPPAAGGPPKPPKPPAADKPPVGMPAMSSSANVLHASQGDQPALTPASVQGMGSVQGLTVFWNADNAKKGARIA